MTLIDHPDNPIPEGGVVNTIRTPDGIELRYAHWGSVGGRRRGTVTLLQGRSEFIEKYFEVIQDLRERGFAVIAFDWRGQGASQRLLRNPLRGHIRSFSQYHRDLETILKKVSLTEYPGPHFALAHSAGAAVLLSSSSRLRTMLDRAVLVAPLIGLPDFAIHNPDGVWPRLRRFFRFGRPPSPPLATYSPGFRNLRERLAFTVARICWWIGLGWIYIPGGDYDPHIPFEGNLQSSDRTRFERSGKVLDKAPELALGSPTMGWLRAAANCMMSFRKRDAGQKVVLPSLIIAAGADRIVCTRAIEEFAARTRSTGYIEIPGAEHELMMEADIFRDQFWVAFDAFVPGSDYE